ncbi:glutamate--tRNA ligase [Roseospirillum parvum]|uniref:Glutamate--tRNA ligase n=1 Tax=Roseospirillum parvum TaxID=83401 RepID=A0A1G8CK79_9PROT|nr:glutamate--tRNA ligase [Roseospirillum parvum]SDH45825.1 glutamyl-tRNA synthetase [Roseospirillum parvum]
MAAPVTRFAPSPTGHLHVGNARVAVLNWLLARHGGGRAILRFDDTDPARSEDRFARSIADDLAWLGLSFDATVHQRDRLDLYRDAARRLADQGHLYPCYETAEELEDMRRRQRLAGRPPVYNRAGLDLSAAERARLEAEGRRPHWRFRLARQPVTWTDLCAGESRVDTSHLSDPVLIRADDSPLYTLPSVVDDLEMGITHVLRGADHATNTAVQIEIIQALGGTPPTFAHIPLLLGPDGGPLSKRDGGAGLADLRDQGIEALALFSLLAGLGRDTMPEPISHPDDLLPGFDPGALGHAAPRFDVEAARRLSARTLHDTPYPAVRQRLADLGLGDPGAAFWEVIRGNLERLDDAAHWSAVCFGEITPAIDPEDRDFLAQAATLLPPEPWTGETWKTWTTTLKETTGRRGKNLFKPLRRALTGRDQGPEMAALMPLIPPHQAKTRLAG